MTPCIAVLLVDGFEEIEAVTVLDVLRRAKFEVVALAVDSEVPNGAHAIALQATRRLVVDDVRFPWDAVVLPGGQPGANTLRDHPLVIELLRAQAQRQGWLAAICAAPIALAQAGVLAGHRVTCYPGYEDVLRAAGALVPEANAAPSVIVDRQIISSRGVGTALAFALELVACLATREVARDHAARMLVQWDEK